LDPKEASEPTPVPVPADGTSGPAPASDSPPVTGAPTAISGRATSIGLGETAPRTVSLDATTARGGSRADGDGGDGTTTPTPSPTPFAKTVAEPGRPPRAPRKERARIGLYELQEELGRGGMGAVYQAWHPLSKRLVALKVIKARSGASEAEYRQLRELFLREGGILMSVAHENVVRCYDANEANFEGEPVLYLALELLDGETLAQRIASRGPLPLTDALRVARGLARALEALHGHPQRILHRDLKPANAFLARDGGVKLLDFGLAGIADWRLSHVSMFAAGSRPYMAPEQFDGLRFCTERSDLYSLGVALFETATGKRPFAADSDLGFVRAHQEKSPPLLVEAYPGIESGPLLHALQNIVTRLLAKKPAERYASATELIVALDRALGGGPISTPRVTRPEVLRRRRLLVRGAAAALVASLAAFGAYSATTWRSIDREIAEAERRRDAFELEGAKEVLERVLARDPNNARAVAASADISSRIARRQAVLERREAALSAGKAGRLKDQAIQAEGLRAEAEKSGVFPAADLTRFAEEAEKAEATRAKALAETAARAGRFLESSDFDRAERDIARTALLAREAERARVLDLGRELAQRRELAAAREALERGDRDNARARLKRLEQDGLVPALTPPAAAIRFDLRAADEVVASYEDFVAQRERDARFAHFKIDQVVRLLAEGGASLERRTGIALAKARELELSQRQMRVFFSLLEATKTRDPKTMRDAVRSNRRLLPAEGLQPETVLALEVAETDACGKLVAAALARAESAFAKGRPDEAEAAAREALSSLTEAEETRFRALARRFAEDRRAKGERAARAALREALRAEPQAEKGWLALERAVAERARPAEMRLIGRLDRVELGREDIESNPVHVVALAPFYVDTTEVTAARYAAFVAATGAPPPATWSGPRPPAGREMGPVAGVDLDEARRFAAWGRRRLPTADEWEAAASVELGRDTRRLYPWGDQWLKAVGDSGKREPVAVGAVDGDLSPFFCMDMGGNVQEWTVEPQPDGGEVAVLQGGSFDLAPHRDFFRAAQRSRPDARKGYPRLKDVGFRCALDAPAPDLADWEKE